MSRTRVDFLMPALLDKPFTAAMRIRVIEAELRADIARDAARERRKQLTMSGGSTEVGASTPLVGIPDDRDGVRSPAHSSTQAAA